MFTLVHIVVHKPVFLLFKCDLAYIYCSTYGTLLTLPLGISHLILYVHTLALSLGRKIFGKKVSDHVEWISKAFTSVEPPVTLECDWWFYTGECFTEPCILAPFLQEGCHKPVLGGWPPACLLYEFWLVLYSKVRQRPQYFWLMVHHHEYCATGWMGWG